MQSRIPHETPDGSPRAAWPGAPLTVELTAALTGARRRAARDRDRETDTAHLLHSLLESDPEVRAVFGGARVVKLLGYLVQRSIGYGLRWQGAAESTGTPPVAGGSGFSAAAARALEAAAVRAVGRGAPAADGLDLLASLVADPDCRAVEVLRRSAFRAAELRARIEAVRAGSARGEEVGN
ncbi:peptidase [Streptomyces sp. SCSIO ZS0520]|uniref:peptidase n=1 Tax=Streptomyces sp. SCSIO ZS0520 TaxID=2892996 RepID=UPI003985D844